MRGVRARSFSGQQAEAAAGVAVLNRIPCAERHAVAEFAGALHDGAPNDAVETIGGQEKGEDRKRAEEARNGPGANSANRDSSQGLAAIKVARLAHL